MALPDADRNTDPGFAHHAPAPVTGPGLGGAGLPRLAARQHLAGPDATPRWWAPSCCSSPAPRWTLDVDPAFEHGVLVDTGVLEVAGTEVKQHELAYVPARHATASS